MVYKYLKSNIVKFFVLLLLVVSDGCKKDDLSIIPKYDVYYELSLTRELAKMGVGSMCTITPNPEDNNFSIVDYHNGQATYSIVWKTRGNGILVYRKNADMFQAFDLTCTYRAFEDYCGIDVKSGSSEAICPCCKSLFLISADGLPTKKSLAVRPLVQYTIHYDGSTLIISN